MKFNSFLFSSFVAFATAASVGKRDAKVIKFDFEDHASLAKRDGSYGADALNNPNLITTKLKVGSNRDPVFVRIDTGSWLTQVFDSNATCALCVANETYDSNKSSSVVKTGKKAQSWFGPNAYYIGEYVYDNVQYGDLVINNFTFNDVYNSSGSTNGLLGLAKPPSYDPINEHIAWAAKLSGATDKAAYSLILQNLDNSPGSLVIGGYDAAKVNGEIHWSSIANSNIHANLTYVRIGDKTIPVNLNYTLDTGGSPAWLPKDEYNQFISNLPFDPNNNPLNSGTYDYALTQGQTFTYNLNGIDYEFPLEAILQPGCTGQHCSIIVHGGDPPQLGAFLFRYLLLAVDLENELVGFATIKNTTESDYRAF